MQRTKKAKKNITKGPVKISLDLPRWVADRMKNRTLYVLLGSECVAVRYADEKAFYVKTQRCRYFNEEKCGICCGCCEYLKNGECADNDRPFKCSVDDPKTMHKNTPECNMKYEVK